MEDVIAAIQAAGFIAYLPTDTRRPATYLFYTDGTRIGYLQRDCGGCSISTVHIPNRNSGTGFGMSETGEYGVSQLTREVLETGFCLYPYWASQTDRGSVKKYRDMAAFLKSRGSDVPLAPAA